MKLALLFLLTAASFAACNRSQPDYPAEPPADPSAIAEDKTETKASDVRPESDFYARGVGPEWTLEIDHQGDLIFTPAAGSMLKCVTPIAAVTEENQVSRYHAKTGQGSMDIILGTSQCTDAKTGETFTHAVKVERTDADGTILPVVEGCGTYIGRVGLAGTWRIMAMDKKPVVAGPNDWPYVKFDIKANQLSGSGGCNRISSTATIAGNRLKTGLVTATKMACPGYEGETVLLQRLSNADFTAVVLGNALLLRDFRGEMRLERIADIRK